MTFRTAIRDLSNGALPATIYRVGQLPSGEIVRRKFANVRTEKQKGKQARSACIGICTIFADQWVEICAKGTP
jgi:hypothetical protein